MKSKLPFFAIVFIWALGLGSVISAAPPPLEKSSALKNAVVLIIRHAERPASGAALSPAGEAHAEAYANYFKNFTMAGQPLRPDYLIAAKDSSSSDRPRLTLEPTAKALGLTIDVRFNDDQSLPLVQELKSSLLGTNILICWHHTFIPALLRALGADPETLLPNAQWPEAVFDWLIELRYDANGQLVESKRITEVFPPADPVQSKPEADANGVAKSGAVTNGIAQLLANHHASSLDPKGNSWLAIGQSIEQFTHFEFLLRLFLSFTLAVACAWLVAWNPRRSTRLASLCDLEERKTLILLGMVGAIVAELSGSNQTLAFVIFGIGALLRFRTVMDNPKLTGKAITVVVIGLACGMGSWTMAVFVTIFSWVLIYWLDSHIACRIRIRVAEGVDAKLVFGSVQALFVDRRCRLQSSAVYKKKRQLEFLMHIPADLDLKQLELDVRAKLPKPDEARIKIDVV